MSACPICKQEMVAEFRPFCSRHCADVDLARWFNGTYTAPDLKGEEEADSLPSLPDQDQ